MAARRPRRRRRRPAAPPRRRDDDDDRPTRSHRRREEDDEDEEDDEYEDAGEKRLTRADLREIAGRQKAIILCILGYLCLVAAQFAIPEESRLLLAIALIPLGLTATVFVFLLATKIYAEGTGVVLGILTLIPCIGLVVLLIINAKATNILKSRGIHVGLLGANTSDI